MYYLIYYFLYKKSYINITEKLRSDKTQVEKDLLVELYKKLYKIGKQIMIIKKQQMSK